MVDNGDSGGQQAVPPVLGIVVPCYNEQEVLPETARRLRELVHELIKGGRIASGSRIWLVDDGSSDHTWSLIEALAAEEDSAVAGIKLSRNRGHQIALLAGLLEAEGDMLVSIDADLQDDLGAIPEMIDHFRAGSEVVYGVRADRSTDAPFKRYTAEAYYRVLNRIGIEIVFNHADYRLLGRRVVEALREYGEREVFLRGLVPQLGFSSSRVLYRRGERFAGGSKYPLARMLSLAWQGITSFSAAPLRVITGLGISVSIVSLALAGWALGIRLFTDEAIPGWASVVVPLFFLSGIQLLAIGVIGEYLAKIYVQVKERPRYFVEKTALGDVRRAADTRTHWQRHSDETPHEPG